MGISSAHVEAAYRAYGHLVVRRCRTILRDEQAADDAMQDVFVRLLRLGDGFLTADNPLRWLYRVTDNVCFDHLARRRRVAVTAAVECAAEPVSPNSLAGAVADRDQAVRLLARLEPPLQRLAMLAFVDELPQDAVARELGWSRQTVNKKLQRLREYLRAAGTAVEEPR